VKPGAIARSSPNQLKPWRVAAGLKQAEVEKILGWPQSRVSHLECGHAVITEEVLQSLAPLYGGTPAALLGPPPKEGVAHQETGAALYETEPMLDRLLAEIQAGRANLEALENQIGALIDSAEKSIEMLCRTQAVLAKATSRKLANETADVDGGQ
jgi:transcriptional regulator with XRE-family HTH domain